MTRAAPWAGWRLAPPVPTPNRNPTIPVDKGAGLVDHLLAWFTPDRIAFIVILFLCTLFVIKTWRMLVSHPVIFAVLVIFALVAAGVVSFGGGAFSHHGPPPPAVPLPGAPPTGGR